MVNKYYQKQKEANGRYQKFSAEEKDKMPRKAQERYQNFTQEKKMVSVLPGT